MSENQFAHLENRRPHSLDNLAIRTFPQQFDLWFKDRYGLRGELISLDALINYYFWGRTIDPSKIVIGENGFLFLGDRMNQVLKQSMNVAAFRDDQLLHFMDILETVQLTLSLSNTELYFTVAPNKHSLYSEYLPLRFSSDKNVLNVYPSLMEQLTTSNIKHIDLMVVLNNAKKEYGDLLYYKTDSHWSTLGAFLAYQAIAEKIRKDFPLVDSLSLKQITPKNQFSNHDLSRIAHLGTFRDHATQLSFQETWQPIEFYHLGTRKPMERPQEWTSKSKEGVTLLNRTALSPRKILVYGDSFSFSLVPFLSQSFSETSFIHHCQLLSRNASPIALVKKLKPDLVLMEMAERLMLDFCSGPTQMKAAYGGGESQKRFDQSTISLLTKSGRDIFQYFTEKSEFVKNVSVSSSRLIIESKGTDPYIVVGPIVEIKGKRRLLFNLEIEAFQSNDYFQFFYQTEKEPFFSESKSFAHTLEQGINQIYLTIDENDGEQRRFNGMVRFDFGGKTGLFSLNSINVKENASRE